MNGRDTPMFAAELAARCGLSVDQFYRHRQKMHARDALPPPISSVGRAAWHRPTIEAWLGRHHPAAPPPAANDKGEKPAPASDEQWRALLHAEYAQGR